ncbi:MAG: HAMP domain-containing protein [Caldilineaceae bacterium]|nr:HAMP domain-containing protein [Caldilineaceae bacterium]
MNIHHATQVLILLTEFRDAHQVADFCESRNWRYWLAENLIQVRTLLDEQRFDLIFVDLQLPAATLEGLIQHIRTQHPKAQLIGVTANAAEVHLSRSDIRSLLLKPVTTERLEQALLQSPGDQAQTLGLDQLWLMPKKLRFPVHLKITLPYLLLSAVVMIAGVLLTSRLLTETMEERFQRQLVDAGIMAADRIVKEEQALLTAWRALAFTDGMTQELAAEDAEALRRLLLPTVINYGPDAVDFLPQRGNISLLSLRQTGEANVYQAWRDVAFLSAPFVEAARNQAPGDGYRRYAGLFHEQGRDFLYVAGPVLDQTQTMVGLLLVGTDVTELANTMKQAVLANITFYDQQGSVLSSTLDPIASPPALTPIELTTIAQQHAQASLVRKVVAGSSDYREVLGVWRTSRGDTLGFYGTALTRALLIRLAADQRLQLALWVILAFLLVTLLGLYLANRITTPLVRLIRASSAVASGNLDVQVDPAGADEIGLLVASFNRMIQQLRESVIYRDLLGRTVSPPVREQLRQAFQAGELRLAGQDVMTTVLMSDIRNFTPLSEQADSTTVLRWLNEYFSELVPAINGNQGVINAFAGDSLVAFFGVLPKPLTPSAGAYHACVAAQQMLAVIEQSNERRLQRGEPPLLTGIALHSGVVTAGGLGSAERLQYTIVGDTVNATSRLGEFTKTFNDNVIVVSQQTIDALGPRRKEFYFEPLGQHLLRGKSAPITLYRLCTARPVDEASSMVMWRVV